MNSKAFRKFYLDVNLSNVVFSLILGNTFGFLWAFVAYCTVGSLIGFISFHFLKKNEFFLYHNLGFSKLALFKKVLVTNLIIALIPMGILLLNV
jgi:hypothetical protein